MVSSYSWVALGHMGLYLALFYWGGMMAERAAGRSIWLFSQSSGLGAVSNFGVPYRICSAFGISRGYLPGSALGNFGSTD